LNGGENKIMINKKLAKLAKLANGDIYYMKP
jgi:hypothetical protein